MNISEWKKTGLKENLYYELINLARKHNLDKLILFGSRARGDFKERSDIDLAFSGGNAVRFVIDTDEDTKTLLMFDIVNLDRPVNPELLKSIQKEGILIYEKNREF